MVLKSVIGAKMSGIVGQFRFDTYAPEEITRFCWLRAVEWIAWPAFLSQPLLPILYVYHPVYWVLLGAILAGFLWLPLRHRFASLQLATMGCLWVRVKWLTIPVALFVLFQQRRYMTVALTLATPWLASILNAPAQLVAAIAQSPSQVGIVQRKFLDYAELHNPPQFTSVG
jgi:hypothetical protein